MPALWPAAARRQVVIPHSLGVGANRRRYAPWRGDARTSLTCQGSPISPRRVDFLAMDPVQIGDVGCEQLTLPATKRP